ncbi:beta-galactosidase, putative [Babesia ovis]|uniref:Beta-galactosidase, putative n=1 Tax=Babesia ovis TaxID=5869 RepID=A0A9W5T7S0_BABOV|nr:beta-galactosidase, putative [Babesia ovis]
MYIHSLRSAALFFAVQFPFSLVSSFSGYGNLIGKHQCLLVPNNHDGTVRIHHSERWSQHTILATPAEYSDNEECNIDIDASSNSDDTSQPPQDAEESQRGSVSDDEDGLKRLRDVVNEEDFDDQLTNLILSEPNRPKHPGDEVPMSKFDWFDHDDPLDSDDELLFREYCAQRVPNLEDIYKKLDPTGIRKYTPTNLSNIEKSLGNVYQVNKPLFDEDALTAAGRTHESPPVLQNKIVGAIDTAESTGAEQSVLSNGIGCPSPMSSSSGVPSTNIDIDVERIRAEATDTDEEADTENHIGEDDSTTIDDDTVLEDDAYRYFVNLPMFSWTTFDKDALDSALSKLSTYHKHYEEKPREPGTSSPYNIFTTDPCSNVGVSDGTCDMSLSEELEALKTVKVEPVNLDIEEYKHSDLLNDIDAYEAAEYPSAVEMLCKLDADLPIFTMEKFEPSYSEVDVVDPRVYISVPKSSINESETDVTVLDEPSFVKRVRDRRLSQMVSEIPLHPEPQIGTILIPNELGYLDQNIRYLADELGVVSHSLVFVPDISDNDLMFSLTMNRLIKLIQTAFNVDRICLVALGNQGRRVIHYVYTAMGATVERTLNLFKTSDPKLDPEKYFSKHNFNRYKNITSRQKTPMLEDILTGVQIMEHSESIKAAERARDYNVIKPLSNILQGIVLWDSVEVNFKEVAELGVPILFNMSNRLNLFQGLLRLDNPDFLSQKKRCDLMNKEDHIKMFDFMDGKVPTDLSDVIGEHVCLRYRGRNKTTVDNPDIYHMTTNHTGIDVYINIFKEASGYFYMKKPDATDKELTALGNAILSCADWINSWAF